MNGSDRVEGISVIIPAYNEASRVGPVVRAASRYADEIIVVDDDSADSTGVEAEAAGARVVYQIHAGYIAAIKLGFREARGEIVVTMDADGEHRAEDIPRLIEPILTEGVDMVLGARPRVVRLSERCINMLTRLRVKGVSDTGTGFRALRRDLALRLELRGRCICGISVLEPASLGARIAEIPIELASISKPRRIAWYHIEQMFFIMPWLMKE